MTRGVWFDNTHSFADLNLILSKSDIPPAVPKTNFVDLPGGDGSIDLSEASGEIRFQDRVITFVFTVRPGDDWERKKTEVSNLLNGRRLHIILDKDPSYYWDGRCAVSEYASNKAIHKITVTATVRPYKLFVAETVHTRILTTTPKEITLENARRAVVPVLECSGAAVIVYNGRTFNVDTGSHKLLDIRFGQGRQLLTVSGSGSLTIRYREGDL